MQKKAETRSHRPGLSERQKSILSSLICILAGILVSIVILVILALTSDMIDANDVMTGIGCIFGGPFASRGAHNILSQVGDMLFKTAPLIMTGLSVAIAFRTGLFNIGAPGQFLMGTMGSVIVALSVPTTEGTAFLVWLLALVVGILCGMLWGAIPGLFKAYLNVNEVIVCIMTNWIAANIVSWVFSVNRQFINIEGGKAQFTFVTGANGVSTPTLFLDKLFPGTYIDCSILLAALIAIGMYYFINKTTIGFELKACGYNKNAAEYAGMNQKRNIVLSMVISGGLAAAGACFYYLNGHIELSWNTYSALPADGFNGIPVALLAGNNPIGVIFSSLLLRFLDKSGTNLAGFTGFNEYVSDLIIALIMYFAGFSKLIRDLLVKKKRAFGTQDASADKIETAAAEKGEKA